MKKTIRFLLGMLLINTVVLAQPPKVPANKGAGFGEEVTAADAVAPENIAALLKDKESADIKVKGVVASVCTARGCFLYLKTATGKIYVKTKDDAFFVPVSLKGKTVVIKGTASVDKESNQISIQATGILVI